MPDLTVSSDVDSLLSVAEDAAFKKLLNLEYAQIEVEGNATATNFSAASTDFSNKVQIVIFTADGISNGATPDHTNDHITINTTGIYSVAASISYSGTGNTTYSFAFFKNNGATQIGSRQTRKIGAGGDVGAFEMSTLASLTAGDTIELWAQDEDGSNSLVVEDAVFSIRMI